MYGDPLLPQLKIKKDKSIKLKLIKKIKNKKNKFKDK